MNNNKRVEVMRFSDSIFKLMKNKYPDFRCFLYDYNSSCIMMVIAASIYTKLETVQEKGSCKIIVPVELLEKFFLLYGVDFYNYEVFMELMEKASYTRNNVLIKQPLVLQCEPKNNSLEVVVGQDLYEVIKEADITVLNGFEIFEQCVEALKQM